MRWASAPSIARAQAPPTSPAWLRLPVGRTKPAVRAHEDELHGILGGVAKAGGGVPIRAQVLGRPTGLILGFQVTQSPFPGTPTYDALCEKPFDQRIAALRDDTVRTRILEEENAGAARGAWPTTST